MADDQRAHRKFEISFYSILSVPVPAPLRQREEGLQIICIKHTKERSEMSQRANDQAPFYTCPNSDIPSSLSVSFPPPSLFSSNSQKPQLTPSDNLNTSHPYIHSSLPGVSVLSTLPYEVSLVILSGFAQNRVPLRIRLKPEKINRRQLSYQFCIIFQVLKSILQSLGAKKLLLSQS